MKILILVKGLVGAAGIVFSSFIEELSKQEDLKIDLLTNEVEYENKKLSNIYTVLDQKEVSERIAKVSTMLFRLNLQNLSWNRKAKTLISEKLKNEKYDLVISFVSGGTANIADLGMHTAKRFNSKFYIHMVDPVPPPPGWEPHELYRKNLVYGVLKPIENCDLISLSNDAMRTYQLKQIKAHKKSFTLPNPIMSNSIKIIERNKSNTSFNYMFLGSSVTGARNPYKLFEAFSKIIDKYPDSYLHFFGNSPRLDKNRIPHNIKNKVIFHEYVKDIEVIIPITDVFIDIDGDLDFDVFISSKLQMYITYNRPILSITGLSSPTRNLLKKLPASTIISSFNIFEISEALTNIRSLSQDDNFLIERNRFIKKNNISILTKKLENEIKNIS